MSFGFGVAWCLALLALLVEHLPGAWLNRPLLWEPGGRAALVLLLFACASLFAHPRRDGGLGAALCLGFGLALPPLAAALALDLGAGWQEWWLLLLIGGMSIALIGAASWALAQASSRPALICSVALLWITVALPGLAFWGRAQNPGLNQIAGFSPLAWLGRSVGGVQAFDARLAIYWVCLLGILIGFRRGQASA